MLVRMVCIGNKGLRVRNFLLFFVLISSFPVKAIEINEQLIPCPATVGQEKKPLKFQQFLGKVVYLDFWATWCPPCKQSMPFLNSMRNELQTKGFEVLAINVDENIDEAWDFLKKYPVDYMVAMDPSGKCPKAYDVMAMPSAYLIDRKGDVRYIHLGFRERDKTEIRALVLELLAEK